MSTIDPLPPPPPAPAPPLPPGTVPNHFMWAVVSTVFATIFSMLTCCCLPIGLAAGIPAILASNRVNRLLTFGDEAGARAASDKAKMWSWVTTGLAIFFAVVFGLSMLGRSMGWIEQPNWQQIIEQAQQQQ